MNSAKGRLLASSVIASVGVMALALPAAAQTSTTSASAGEVVVTGSRIARRDFVAESPIVSVSPAAIENTGDVTLERLLNNMPQIVPGLGSQINNGGNGQINIQLRGLGATRTLVLVDGRRTTPSNSTGVVDINTIPQAMIESIEVITGGASATYGSDALGGVVNFKLKHRFTGVQIDAAYNISALDDGEQNGVAITVGGNFADDRGNAVLSMGYDNRQSVFYGNRPNVKVDGISVLAVSGPSPSIPQGTVVPFLVAANQPSQAAINTVFGSYGVAAGTIGRNFPLGFNSDGTLFNGSANYRGPTSIDFSTIPLSAPGSGNAGSYNTGALNYILTPQTRYNVFSRAEYAITNHLKAYAQFNYANYTASTVLAPSPASNNPAVGGTGFQVSSLYPFIPADLRTILNSRADPNAPFIFNKRFSELGGRNTTSEYANYQMLAGLQGDVPGYDLNYDFYMSYGHLDRVDVAFGNVSHANVAALLASSTGSAGGCTGYNLFGLSNPSAACRAFISQPTKNYTTYDQRQAEGTLQGHLFNLPAGEARFAIGADYRIDKYGLLPDALLSSRDTTVNSYTAGGNSYTLTNNTAGVVGGNAVNPLAGYIDVYELFGEALVPILKDLPFIQSLKADIGVRESFYNRAGNAFAWKATGDWKVNDLLMVRGGYNRAIRAPNINELFAPQTNGFFEIGDPTKGVTLGDPCDIRSGFRAAANPNRAQVRALCLAQGIPAAVIDNYQYGATQVQATAGGNPNLKPETADTYTGGLVITPHFSYPMLRRLTMSIDYYSVKISGFIGAVGPGTSIPKCFNFDGTSNPSYAQSYSLCNLFQRDPATGQIVQGQAFNNNLGGIKTSGIDFVVDWSFRLSDIPAIGLPDRFGQLNLGLIGSWLNSYQVETLVGDPFVEQRKSITSGGGGTATGAYPIWKGVINASYSIGAWQFGLTERYIGEMKDGGCVGIVTVCTARGADPTFYTDINARWKMTDNLELRAGVTNATDQWPRFFASGSSSQGGTDGTTYDLIGRRYFVALKARF